MFVYRPHVRGAEIITTPDLILDMALATDTWSPPLESEIGAAWVIVAAQNAPLVTVGLLENGRPWVISRQAWRLSDVMPGWSALSLAFHTQAGESRESLAGVAVPHPTRGEARFVVAAAPIVAPGWCCVELLDTLTGRSIAHRIQFSSKPESQMSQMSQESKKSHA